MAVVCFLPQLLAGRVEVRAVRYNDVVAAVGGWVPNGLVLAHEERCDPGGQPAQGGRLELWGLG